MKPGPRWGISIVAATIMIAGSLVGAIPAQGVPPTVPAIELAAGNPGDSSLLFEYGATAPASRMLTIGPDTATIAFAPPFGPASPEISCALEAEEGVTIAERTWSDSEWWSDPSGHTLALPRGAVTANGALYTASCVTRAESSAEAIWTLVGGAGGPTVLTLDDSPVKATRTTQREPLDGGAEALDTAVARGERVRIRGAAGIWFPAGGTGVLEVQLADPGGAGYAAEEVSATPDGSVLGFTLPSGLPASPGSEIRATVTSTSTVPGSSSSPDQVTTRIWNTRLVVTAKATTNTAMTLDRRVVLSSRTPVHARVTVTDPGRGPIDGTVTLVIDGKTGPVVAVSGSGAVSTSIRLPALVRGKHSVVAVFGGSESLLGSSSAARQVRRLF